MLTPEYLADCADDLTAIYSLFETSIIEDMARRIMRMGGVSETTVNQSDILQEAGALYGDVLRELSALTGESERELYAAFQEAGAKALQYDDEVYRVAGLSPAPLSSSAAMQNLLRADIHKTGRNLRNLTMTTAATTQAQFIEAVNLAHMQVSRGGMDYNRAIRDALKSLASQGVTAVRYDKNGRASYHKVDVAVRRAVLTGVNQTAGALQILRMEEMDWDLVEVTAHMGARPDHAEWQGKVYSRCGRHDRYPDFESSTGYGTGAGLCGWNCRHNFGPFYEGYSRRSYTDRGLDEIGNATVTVEGEEIALYEATQIQREKEREVRSLKRELAALHAGINASADDTLTRTLRDAFDATALTLKTKEKELDAFTRETRLIRQREREQVVGFDRSAAQKAVWAARR